MFLYGETMTYQERKKKFENLTIQDDWMFKAVLSNPKNIGIVKRIAERCLKRKIKDIKYVTPEATVDPFYYSKGVRFDIMFESDDFYCVLEMQTYDDAFPLRSKYYHDVLDALDIQSGKKYKEMEQTYVVFFMNEDYLHGDLPIYTTKTIILEKPELNYDDKRTTIFINPKAFDANSDDEMSALSRYIDSGKVTDSLTKDISEAIEEIKLDKFKRIDFMTLDEKFEHVKEEGRFEEKEEIALNLIKMGYSYNDIKKATGLSVEHIESLKNKI